MSGEIGRKSIIHALNVFLVNPINIYPSRTTQKYLIGYEPKQYRVHKLMFKISKDLISDSQNPIRFNTGLDINIREDYRYSIKMNDPKWAIKSKNITIRIIGTRYAELSPLYGTFYYFEWRKTAKGGADELDFSIPECPTISNSSTVTNVCYKHIASQTSGGGTHAFKTYMILSPQRGTFEIGKHIKISNESLHTYIYPVSVTF